MECRTPALFQPRLLAAALVAVPSSRLPQSTEQHAFARLARGQATRTTRRQGSRVSPRGARSSRHGQWPVVACTRVRVQWCDALSRPVAHSASSRTAHGYTLVIHTRAVEITSACGGGRGDDARSARSWRPSALLAFSPTIREIVRSSEIFPTIREIVSTREIVGNEARNTSPLSEADTVNGFWGKWSLATSCLIG